MIIPSFLKPEVLPYAVVEIVRDNGRIEVKPIVLVCAWHTSVEALVKLQRQFPGQVSHALCPACAEKFEAVATS